MANIELPRFQVWRLIHKVQRLEACDSLVAGLEREIDLSQRGLKAADTVIAVMEKRLQLSDEAQRIQTERIGNQVQANQELKKEVRKQKRLKLLAIGGIVLALLI